MKLINGKTYFNEQNNKTVKAYPYLNKNIETDILIIGGGISSAITAWYLAKEGYNICIAEKNIIGYGSTRGTTAILDYQASLKLKDLEELIGEKRAETIYKKCLKAINHIQEISEEIEKDTEFKRVDSIMFTDSKKYIKDIEEEYICRKDKGYNVNLEDKVNSNRVKKCIRTVNASAVINPYLFTVEVFRYLEKKYNVQIYENTRIDDIQNKKDKVINTTNNDYVIVSKHTILATGYDSAAYIKDKNSKLYAKFTIVTNKQKNLDKLNLDYTAMDNKKVFNNIRFTRDNRIIIEGEDIVLGNNKIDSKKMQEKAQKKYLKLYDTLIKIFYMLEDVQIEYAYTEVYIKTRDSLPIIDKVKNLNNVYCNLAYGSNGILYSVIGANYLKEIIDKGNTSVELEMFEINRNI